MMLNRRESILNRFFVFCLISFFALIPAGPIRAVSMNGLVAYPADSAEDSAASESWFLYGLDRGESKRDSFVLLNDSEEKRTVAVYAADSATDDAGGFVLETAADPKDGVGRWITLDNDTVALEPGERKTIGFTIAIPEDAPTGEVSGGIVIQRVLEEAKSDVEGAAVTLPPLSIRVYETVPEMKVEKLSFGGYAIAYDRNAGSYVLRLTVKNEGNVFLEPVLEMKSSDLIFASQDGFTTQKLAVPAGSEIEVIYPLKSARVGRFEVSPVLSFGEEKDETAIRYPRAIYFWAMPWTAIRIVIFILLAYMLCWIFRYARERRDRRYRKNYRVAPSENLDDLSEKLGISWKRIVRMNDLKPPYQIAKGQLITVIDRQNVLDQPYIKKEEAAKVDVEWENWKADGTYVSNFPDERGMSAKRKASLLVMMAGAALIIWACAYHFETSTVDEKADIAQDIDSVDVSIGDTADTTDADAVPSPAETVTESPEIETPAEVIEELPTPELTDADRAHIKIEILNGNGIKGVSSRASAAFQAKGYTTTTTGNADRFDYARTELTCGAGMDERICEEAKAILVADYPATAMSTSAKLASDAIRITLGG